MKYSLENQLNVSKETPIIEIVEIDSHFIGPNDVVVVPFWIGLLSKQFFLVAILDAGRSCNAGTKLQNATVFTLKLVGIAWHVGSRPHKAHLSNEDINQFSETIHLAVAQPTTYACHPWIVGCGDGIPFCFTMHGAELADTERLSIFSYTPLHEKQRAF